VVLFSSYEIRGVDDRRLPLQALVLLEAFGLELQPEVAPVGDDVAADGVVLGEPRAYHLGRDLVGHEYRHVVDLGNAMLRPPGVRSISEKVVLRRWGILKYA